MMAGMLTDGDRGYIQSAIVKLQDMQKIYPSAGRLSRELEQDYIVLDKEASKAMQLC